MAGDIEPYLLRLHFTVRQERHANAAQEVDHHAFVQAMKRNQRPHLVRLQRERRVSEQGMDRLRPASLGVSDRFGMHPRQVALQAPAPGQIPAFPPQWLPARLAGVRQKLEMHRTRHDAFHVPYRPMVCLLDQTFRAEEAERASNPSR